MDILVACFFPFQITKNYDVTEDCLKLFSHTRSGNIKNQRVQLPRPAGRKYMIMNDPAIAKI
jgi:hypothetical protein